MTSPTSWGAGRPESAIVPQSVYLTVGSMRENIAFGVEPDAVDTDRLARVVAHAQLDEVLAHLQQGIDAKIGEAGDRLSGGQRQRIGVARALYADPYLPDPRRGHLGPGQRDRAPRRPRWCRACRGRSRP